MQSLKKLISCSSKPTRTKETGEHLLSNPALRQRIIEPGSNSERKFIIQHGSIKIALTASESELPCLKVAWLISQASTLLSKKLGVKSFAKELSTMVALTTIDEDVKIDYFLTIPQLPLSLIPDGTILKPYLAQELSKTDNKPAFEDFDFISVLGRGGFSSVFLARMKTNGKFYAVKRINKQNGKADCYKYRKCALREKMNLMKVKSDFMAQMHFAFQTQNYFYFVIDYIPGGNLYNKLKEKSCFDEETAKFYVAELLLGIQYLHDNNIIYRDLKPDNLLFDENGHLCFTDFGLSKSFKSKKEMHFSFSGTPEYMAPEIMVGLGYNCLADFYSLGALAYELVFGVPPFQNEGNTNELYKSVMDAKPKCPSHATPEFIDFVERLLDKRPPQRLGANGIEEIMTHRWLANIDFKAIQRREIKPPMSINPESFNLKRTITEMPKDSQNNDMNDSRKVSKFSHFSLSELSQCMKGNGFLVKNSSSPEAKNLFADTNTREHSPNSLIGKYNCPQFPGCFTNNILNESQDSGQNRAPNVDKFTSSLESKVRAKKNQEAEAEESLDEKVTVAADGNHYIPYQTRLAHVMLSKDNVLTLKTKTETQKCYTPGNRLFESVYANRKLMSIEPEWRLAA